MVATRLKWALGAVSIVALATVVGFATIGAAESQGIPERVAALEGKVKALESVKSADRLAVLEAKGIVLSDCSYQGGPGGTEWSDTTNARGRVDEAMCPAGKVLTGFYTANDPNLLNRHCCSISLQSRK